MKKIISFLVFAAFIIPTGSLSETQADDNGNGGPNPLSVRAFMGHFEGPVVDPCCPDPILQGDLEIELHICGPSITPYDFTANGTELLYDPDRDPNGDANCDLVYFPWGFSYNRGYCSLFSIDGLNITAVCTPGGGLPATFTGTLSKNLKRIEGRLYVRPRFFPDYVLDIPVTLKCFEHCKDFIWPVPAGGRITSRYGWRCLGQKACYIRCVCRGGWDWHGGIDIAAEPNTPIIAAASGVVHKAGWARGYGQRVFIQHTICGKTYYTVYGHLSKITVKKGDYVEQGEMIGKMGNSGRVVGKYTGVHLHFGVGRATWLDPLDFVDKYDPPVNPSSYSITAELNGNYSDYGIDTDGDGLYDYLAVDFDVNVTSAGDYDLKGFLYDSNGTEIITWAENYTYLDSGIQTVRLQFYGMEIYAHKIDGPYSLTVGLYDEIGNEMDYQTDAYMTTAYNYTDFQAALEEFTGYYSDYGTDTNSDGLFDYLTIELGVNVPSQGDYSIEGTLYDGNDNVLAFARSWARISGLETIQLNFDGRLINRDGPYALRDLSLYRANEYWEDELLLDYKKQASTTSSYTRTEFQPSPARLTGYRSDYGTDADSDGLFDYLTVETEVNAISDGNYLLEGMLYDVNDEVVAWGGDDIYLSVGVQTVQLNFNGILIYAHGVNGPYSVSSLSISDANGTIVNYQFDVYITSAYNFTDFQRGGEIAGFVTDANGMGVHEAYVSADGPRSAFVFTDVNGSYTIPWLPSGLYEVSVSPPVDSNLLGDSAIVTVIDGNTTFANFTLYDKYRPNLDRLNPVNLIDFSIVGNNWRLAGQKLSCDLNTDGVVDFNDLSIFAIYWLSDCYE